MYKHFKEGMEISNFCNGYFGRDDYERKVCVLVRPKYAVFEYEDGTATVLNYSQQLDDTLRQRGFENWRYEE
jgi:hypothetical protein